jgi:hypothetical protein
MKICNRSSLLIFLLISLLSTASAGKRDPITVLEDSLQKKAKQIRVVTDDKGRLVMNQQFLKLLKEGLNLRGSFDYPFDSLKTIAKLYSPDKTFRIYNWNLPMSDGTNSYFCLIQMKEKKKVRLIELYDVGDTLKNPETTLLTGRKWFGALYYKIIATTLGSRTYYTLLGWNGLNPQVYRKLIEVLTFDGNRNPLFGARIFPKYQGGKNVRVLFSYSSQTTMVLRYEQQSVTTGKKQWDSNKKRFESEERSPWMILFDQLAPLTEPQEGQPSSNIPLGENLDGFYFENGNWIYLQNISAKNH